MFRLGLAILAIVLLIIFLSLNTQNKEHFQWEPRWKGLQSQDCYTEKPENCLKYSNCGFCLNNDGKQPKCIPGDNDGPMFQEHCPAWMHSNYYDRHIFGEKVTRITPSWAQFYPEYEYTAPSPISRSALQ